MRHAVITPAMRWSVDDEHGENPLGKPGVIDFDVTFEITPEIPVVMYDSNMEGYPGSSAYAEVAEANCTSIWLDDDEERRPPTTEERKQFNDWFFVWLAAHPATERYHTRRALELTADDF